MHLEIFSLSLIIGPKLRPRSGPPWPGVIFLKIESLHPWVQRRPPMENKFDWFNTIWAMLLLKNLCALCADRVGHSPPGHANITQRSPDLRTTLLKYDQHYPRIVEVNVGQALFDIFKPRPCFAWQGFLLSICLSVCPCVCACVCPLAKYLNKY